MSKRTRRNFIQVGLGAAVASASSISAAASQTETTEVFPPQPAFLIVYRAGPAWPPGKKLNELPLRDHGRYMLDLYRRGLLYMAGGFLDDSGGAAVLRIVEPEQARAIAEADPAVVTGLFTYELRPWRLMDWAKLAARASR